METKPRRGWTAILAAVGSIVGLAALAGSADAATVELSGDQLTIGGDETAERLQLDRKGQELRVRQLGRDPALTTESADCTAVAVDQVRCPAGFVKRIEVSTGGGYDRFVVGKYFPASDERAGCQGNELGAKLAVRTGGDKDYAELSAGDDIVAGGAKRDVLLGCQGDDRVRGGGGGDRLSGDRGDDSIRGNKSGDWLVGCSYDPDDVNYPKDERGADTLVGGSGADFLFGCKGTDRYRAGQARDTINARDRDGERIGCDGGLDLVYVDPSDRLAACERRTNCTTDNFPFFPCSSRLSQMNELRFRIGGSRRR